jgi:RNA polymerase sigma-B factor
MTSASQPERADGVAAPAGQPPLTNIAGDWTARNQPATEVTRRLLCAYHKDGNTRARERLIELYMPLVRALARRHADRGEEHEDLVQVGSIGLIKAIDRYSLERGGELAAYASPTISGEIKRHLRDRGSLVRVPRRLQEQRALLARAEAELSARLGRPPTASELEAELDLPSEDVALVMEARRAAIPVSLSSEGEDRVGESVLCADEPGFELEENELALSSSLQTLDGLQRQAVYLHHVRGLASAEVAKELGVSDRRVALELRGAAQRLRGEMVAENTGGSPEAQVPAPGSPPPPGRRPPGRARRASKPSIPAPESGSPTVQPSGDASDQSGEVERFLDLPYHIAVAPGDDNGHPGQWTARVEELVGCTAEGATRDEAVGAIREAMRHWLEEARREGRPVPPPKAAAAYSGRLLLRMPQTLHAEVARRAVAEDVSINQLIVGALWNAVGRSASGSGEHLPDRPAGAKTSWTAGNRISPRVLRAAVLTYGVVLVIVALLAVALLVLAWQRGV